MLLQNLILIRQKKTCVKDFEEYVYIARAYMNANKPDYKKRFATLELAKDRSAMEPKFC
jgi:hypothetical protein